MLRRTILGLLAALPLACASAPVRPAPEPFELTRANAFLYEVSRPESAGIDLYLLGSVHVLDVPLELGPALRADFDRADVLVMEIDPEELTPKRALALMMQFGLLEPEQQLEDVLSPGTLAMLRQRIAEPDFAPEERIAIERMRPWAIAMLLVAKSVEAVAGHDNGVEETLAGLADDETPIVGLETPEDQFLAMATMSDSLADAMLRQHLETPSEGASEIESLLAAWKSGDEANLAETLDFGEGADAERLYRVLILDRNETMSAGIRDLLEQDRESVYFGVVGSAHLLGAGSVQELLRAAGYRVERAH